eukprot:gb/GECG01001079.1/.p1 GENE.gb/GECG01001079.1/~~gb/GECG01001079.1/.p1  ORF type:complete len:115 (+),score=5.87 gb/GECG01001079.1/:1-345(+)
MYLLNGKIGARHTCLEASAEATSIQHTSKGHTWWCDRNGRLLSESVSRKCATWLQNPGEGRATGNGGFIANTTPPLTLKFGVEDRMCIMGLIQRSAGRIDDFVLSALKCFRVNE